MPAIHWKDAEGKKNPTPPEGKPFRLFGVNLEGKYYFYWSEKKGLFAGYAGRGKPWKWGTLTCEDGKGMNDDHRVFIADRDMVNRLERAGILRPCRGRKCNDKAEYQRWLEEQQRKGR